MTKKLIDLYKEWMVTGVMAKPLLSGGGLCHLLPLEYVASLSEFKPTDEEELNLSKDGFDCSFWASGMKVKSEYGQMAYGFTPLRQTIVLFICAMHNEL